MPALLLSLGAVAAFTWATRRGQFDDIKTPAIRALHDTHLDSSRESGGDAVNPAPGAVAAVTYRACILPDRSAGGR